MKIKTYALLSECIERGIDAGWRRAHKHTDQPTERDIKTQIEFAIDAQIAEFFSFDDELPI